MNPFLKNLALFLLLFSGLVFISCKKDPDSLLGSNMHGNDDLVAQYDTNFHIQAFSVADDSMILQNASRVLLGASYSNVFGSRTYNLATHLLTQTNTDGNFSKGNLSSNQVDSVILYIPFSSVFPRHHQMDGKELTLTVFRINETLRDTSEYTMAYPSNYQVSYDPIPVSGPITVYPKPFDTVYDSLSSSLIVKPLQVRLENSFGKELLDIFRGMSESERADIEAFPNHFKGIYIKSEAKVREGEDIVFSMSTLFADGANLSIFYNGTGKETSYLKFALGPVRFTHIERDRRMTSDALYRSQMEKEFDTLSGAQRLYLEGAGGSRIRFRIPDFYSKVAGKIVVNQALLVLKNVQPKADPAIGVPSKLECIKYIDRGNAGTIPSASNSSGSYKKETGVYQIDITRYLQQLAFQTTVDPANEERFLDYVDIIPESEERAGKPTRVVFYGPGADVSDRMRLKVIYTIINDSISL